MIHGDFLFISFFLFCLIILFFIFIFAYLCQCVFVYVWQSRGYRDCIVIWRDGFIYARTTFINMGSRKLSETSHRSMSGTTTRWKWRSTKCIYVYVLTWINICIYVFICIYCFELKCRSNVGTKLSLTPLGISNI